MVLGGDRKNYKINFRSSSSFSEKTRIHLGEDITRHLEKIFPGEGGGHDRAAGFNIREKNLEKNELDTGQIKKVVIDFLNNKLCKTLRKTKSNKKLKEES